MRELLYGNRLSEIARLINVGALEYGCVISEQLRNLAKSVTVE